MHSFFAESVQQDRGYFSKEDLPHILRVLRLKEGEDICLVFEGRRYLARFHGRDEAFAQIAEELPSTEPKTKITLYQGIAKGDKMDWIVQKCTELGVFSIVPCYFQRCIAPKDNKKQARLQKIAREAAKQSKRCMMPLVEDAISVDELKKRIQAHEKTFIAWEDESKNSLQSVFAKERDIGIIIGPEGGIEESEISTLSSALPVTLGKRILRCETAGLVLMSAILTLAGDLQ